MVKGFSFFLFLLCCTSCTLGDNYRRPDFYSDEHIAAELKLGKNGKALPEKWYLRFRDNQLKRLIETGLQNSPDVKSAIAKLRKARAEMEISKTIYLPQVNLQGSYNYEKSSRNLKMAEDSHYYTVGFDSSWEFDIWGKGRRQTEAASAQLQAAEYNLQNVYSVLAAEIVTLYVKWCQSSENLRLAEENLRLQKDLLNMVKAKQANGLADEQAYNEAEYLYQNTSAQIPVYENERESYQNALSVAVGILPSELDLQTNAGFPLFKKYYKDESKALHDLPAAVIRLRPDVAAAEQQLIAQNALIGKAVAELYPAVSVSGLWGFVSQGGSKLLSSKSQSYNYEPLLTVPLLDWQRLQKQIQMQKFSTQEALENYKKTVLQAVSELKNSLSAYETALKKFQRLDIARNNMQKAADSVARKYKNGLTEFSVVLQAQQNLLKAQESVISAQADINQSLAAYYKASGAPVIGN